jgi:hypothetical protein
VSSLEMKEQSPLISSEERSESNQVVSSQEFAAGAELEIAWPMVLEAAP